MKVWYNKLIKNLKIRIFEIFLIFIIACTFSVIPQVSKLISEFIKINPIIYIYILFLFLYYWLLHIYTTKYLVIFILLYGIFLMINLFIKVSIESSISTKFYLKEWIKLLFINRIVFINVIGNIILFMPLGYLLKSFFKNNILVFIIGIVITLILELIQFITKLGVFDLIDIFLNALGIIIGLILKRIELWMTINNQDN